MRPANILLFLALPLSTPVAAACFEVWSAGGRLIYQDVRPPFDVSYPPVSAASAESRRRGEVLVVGEAGCPRASEAIPEELRSLPPGTIIRTHAPPGQPLKNLSSSTAIHSGGDLPTRGAMGYKTPAAPLPVYHSGDHGWDTTQPYQTRRIDREDSTTSLGQIEPLDQIEHVDTRPRSAVNPHTGTYYPGVEGGVVNPKDSLLMPRVGPNQYFDVGTGKFLHLEGVE